MGEGSIEKEKEEKEEIKVRKTCKLGIAEESLRFQIASFAAACKIPRKVVEKSRHTLQCFWRGVESK